jgi:hypothetical protein
VWGKINGSREQADRPGRIALDVEKCQDFNLRMDHQAMIRTVWESREKEVNGVMEAHTADSHSRVIVAAAAAIWTDFHATLTYTERIDGKDGYCSGNLRKSYLCPGVGTMYIVSDMMNGTGHTWIN